MGDVLTAQLMINEEAWDEFENEMEKWFEINFSDDYKKNFCNKYNDAYTYLNELYKLYKEMN
jgi:hypothetical protein